MSIKEKIKESWAKKDLLDRFAAVSAVISLVSSIVSSGLGVVFNVFEETDNSILLLILIIFPIIFLANFLIFLYSRGKKHAEKILSKFVNEINENISTDQYKFVDGVIAVSAIIIDQDNKFLLLRDRMIQPGTRYKYKKILRKDDEKENEICTPTPYEKLFSCIKKETGIDKSDLDFIDLTHFGDKEEQFLLERLKNILPRFHRSFQGYERHKLSPPPFLIAKEYPPNGERIESSKELFHIDLYYAFKIREGLDPNEYEKKDFNFYTLDEIKAMLDKQGNKLKKDLFYVFSYFNELYVKIRCPKHEIRTCTFNHKKSIICWRLLDRCNSECIFCLMGDLCKKNNREETSISFDKDMMGNLKKKLKKENYKLIITGGEPSLCTNLYNLILDVKNELQSIKSITICTNAINTSAIITLAKLKESFRDEQDEIVFTINLPAYDEVTYKLLTGRENAFAGVCSSIDHLNNKNIDYTINVVLTQLFKQNINKYLEFWRNMKIKKIALSYIIRNDYNKLSNNQFLSRQESIDIYNKIHGENSIFFLETCELLLSDCGRKNCDAHSNITTIDHTGHIIDNCFEISAY